MVKSKYRNKPKDLKDMFDTYKWWQRDGKNIGKYDEKNERNVKWNRFRDDSGNIKTIWYY